MSSSSPWPESGEADKDSDISWENVELSKTLFEIHWNLKDSENFHGKTASGRSQPEI